MTSLGELLHDGGTSPDPFYDAEILRSSPGVLDFATGGTVRVRLDAAGSLEIASGLKFAAGQVGDNVRLFNGAPEGSLTMYGVADGVRTGLDIGPTRGVLPTADALAEVVLYRTQEQGTNYERMNWTAGSATIPHYRFGVERGGTGQFREVIFSFENVTPGVAHEVLRIKETHVGAASHPIAVDKGHLRFDTPAMGGDRGSYYLGRGGGATLTLNAPAEASVNVLIDNQALLSVGPVAVVARAPFYPATPALATQAATALYAGPGVPPNGAGADGDFYLRSDGGVSGPCIYHREAGAWIGRA